MRFCDRCGIDVEFTGLCDDCVDVTGEQATVRTRFIPKGKSFYVGSSRPVGTRTGDRAHILAEVKRLTLAARSANQVAIELGVCTRTVQRMRAEWGVVCPPINPAECYRDPVAAKRNLAAANAAWRMSRSLENLRKAS